MADRLSELKSLGFNQSDDYPVEGASAAFGGADTFGGYGEFTPISITTKTKLQDADMERGKPRNREN
ncbi:MAG: hypothetical protein AAFY35_16480 [Pseudomonadota bacterium]